MTAPGTPQWAGIWPPSPAEQVPGLAQQLQAAAYANGAPDQQTQDALEQLHATLGLERPAFSIDRDSKPDLLHQGARPNGLAADPLGVLDATDPEPPASSLGESLGLGNTSDRTVQQALRTMYGDQFPLADPQASASGDAALGGRWADWATNLWSLHSAGVQLRLHLVERNRLFRRGVQWVSAVGIGPWREPPKPRESARAVDNMIAPALDQRIQILADQRPGFRVRPENQDQKNLKRAEAQQQALEYQFDQQSMRKIVMELSYWAGTDGCSFGEVHWDPDAGPWDELYLPQTDHTGQPIFDANGILQTQSTGQMPMGELRTRVRRFDQVRVSPGASANVAPSYWVIRDAIAQSVAVQEYGPEVLDRMDPGPALASAIDVAPAMRMGYQFPVPDELLRNIPTVDRYTIYCERSDVLTQGLMLVVVGRKVVVQPMPLPWGVVPIFRWTDGSSDPSFFCKAIMEDWIDAQMRVNVLKSKWIESIRLNAGGKLLARENSLSTETLVGGTTTVVGVKGPIGQPIGDMVEPFPNFSVGADVKELLAEEVAVFEKLSGYTDETRGKYEGDPSGRAILAIREQLERIFAPMVNAASESMEEWAKISIAGMRWGYDTPRRISVEGQGRPDLARELTASDFDGVANILIDPETLMPLPRALRLFILDDLYSKGMMSQQEYRKRLPFAFTQSIDSPDVDHYARANRSVEYLRQSLAQGMPNPNPPECPILWQDNEAIHQDVLERQLILPDDPTEYPPQLRSLAFERWMMLAQQAAMKQMGMPPGPQPGGAPAPQGGGAGPQGPRQARMGPHHNLPPDQRPMQGTNPSISAGTADMMAGNNQQVGAHQFDVAQHQ